MKLFVAMVASQIAFLLPLFTGTGIAGRPVISSVVSNEEQVVVAVRPYDSKSERKWFRLSSRTSQSIPVGVMIQNYGKDRISIEQVSISSMNSDRVSLPHYTPYNERSLGAIADRDFFSDGDRINSMLRDKFIGSAQLPRLGINEYFHESWIGPGESFYGLVFPERRNKKLQPVDLESIEGLQMEVRFRTGDLSKAYVAKISLDGNGGNSITPAPRVSGESNFKCEHAECNKMDSRYLYDVSGAFSECYSKSIAKNRPHDEDFWGKYANSWIKFNKKGDYLSHEVTGAKKGSKLAKITDSVSKGMGHCQLSASQSASNSVDTESFYSVRILVGDSVGELMDADERYEVTQSGEYSERVSTGDPTYIKYIKDVREKIIMNWIPSAECLGVKIRVNARIDRDGNVTKAELLDKRLNGKCAQLAMNVVIQSSPLPLPPKDVENETFEDGFIIDFQQRH